MLANTEIRAYKKPFIQTGGIIGLIILGFVVGELSASQVYWYLPLVLILGLFAFFITLRRPMAGFALMFFFISLAPATKVTEALSAGGVLLGGSSISALTALLLAGIFISRVLVQHQKIKLDRVSWLICAFISWAVITTLWAYNPMLSLHFIFRFIQMVILYILALNYCRSQKQLDIFVISFIIGTILAAAIPVLTGITGKSETRASLGERVDPNFFSAGIGLGLILIFGYFRKVRNILAKVALVVGSIICGYLIIRGQSRGVWIAFSASFIISIFILYRDSKLVKNAIKILLMLAVLGISAYYAGVIDEEIISRFETLSSKDPVKATSGRSEILKVSLRIIEDSLLLGVGFKNYNLAYKEYAPNMNVSFISKGGDPHNTFIAILAETGLVGLVIFAAIFIYLFNDIRRLVSPITRFTYMWLFLYLVFVSSTLTFHYTSWFWTALIFIALTAKFDKQSTLKMNNRPLYSSKIPSL